MLVKNIFETTRSDLWAGAITGVIVIGATIAFALRRILEILPNQDVPVEVFLDAEARELALPGLTREVPVEFDRATVLVSDLSPGT